MKKPLIRIKFNQAFPHGSNMYFEIISGRCRFDLEDVFDVIGTYATVYKRNGFYYVEKMKETL